MSKHIHTKESSFIPAPYPIMTEYEDAFVESYSKNLAMGIAETLKYIAKKTAEEIKQNAKEELS